MKQTQPFYVRLAISLVCLVFSVLILREASALLIPLFGGFLLAIVLLPLVHVLERKGTSRSGASMIAVSCFILAFFTINYFLTAQLALFSTELPNINNKMQEMFAGLQSWFSSKFHIDQAHQINYLSSSFKDIVTWVTGFASRLVLYLGNIIVWILFVCIYAYFILYYRRLLVRFVMKLLEKDYPDQVQHIIRENKKVIKEYIVGLLLEFLIVLLLSFFALLILNIKYAMMLAIIVALLNIVPYLGIYTAVLFVMLVTYANSTGTAAIQAAVALLIIHFIDALFLLPRIVGSRMKMNPFITIIAVITGDIIWGVPGMFLFIPLAAMLKIIFQHISSMEAWAILLDEDKPVKKKKRTADQG